MNIITNKDVFSEENQAGQPKKAGGGRGRPRKVDLAAVAKAAEKESAQAAPAETPADAKKTTFYQAAKPAAKAEAAPAETPADGTPVAPRTISIGRFPRRAPKTGTAIQPAGRTQVTPASFAPQTPRPQGQQAPQDRPPRQHPTGFQTGPRRPDKGRLPQDNGGVFMTPGGALEPLSGSEQPKPAGIPGERLKIIPLGGLEEIGKNMTVFEYGNDILIVDMGFMFPDQDMPGVDYVIPDITYLEGKKQNIRGAIITHGHLDHTGAIPYLVQRLGFPTLYGTAITMGMAKGRLEEFGLAAKNKLVAVEPEKDVLQLGAFTVRPFRLMHSIPGAIGLEIETPCGRIAYCTDWKFDYTPASGDMIDFRSLAAVGSRGVDLLFSDSTNVDRPGHSISEKVVEESLNKAIGDAKGRVIIAMFASDLNRIQMALNAAAKSNRKVLCLGRSIMQNVEMAIGLKALNIPPHTIISEREVSRFPDEQILVISTGAQGEERSALQRMAAGEHKTIKIRKGDTAILSSSPIPGNERSVSNVMDKLYKAGATVIYNKVMDTHTSGHAYQEDLKLMIALMRPKYFLPLHGERARRILHGKLAQEIGVVAPENVVIGDNGGMVEMDENGHVHLTENQVPAGYVMVDGLGIGDVGNIVIRDRQAMAQEGVFFIVSVFDKKAGRFLNSPDIISRGFIYMRENERFVNEVRGAIKDFLAKATSGKKNVNMGDIRNDLRDMVAKHLFEKTERQPMVIPVIIEV